MMLKYIHYFSRKLFIFRVAEDRKRQRDIVHASKNQTTAIVMIKMENVAACT